MGNSFNKKELGGISLVGCIFISPKKKLMLIAANKATNNTNNENLLRFRLILTISLIAQLCATFIIMYFVLDDYSVIIMKIKLNDFILFFSFLEIPIIWAFLFVAIYLYLFFWLIPSLFSLFILKKRYPIDEKSAENKPESGEAQIFSRNDIFSITSLSLVPLIIIYNIFILILSFKIELLKKIDEIWEYLVLLLFLMAFIYYIKNFIDIINFGKEERIFILKFGQFFVFLLYFTVILGVFFL